MSEPPPHNDDPKLDDELPPLDAEAEFVTDPLAIALGSAAAGGFELPEPMLGSDEDEPASRKRTTGRVNRLIGNHRSAKMRVPPRIEDPRPEPAGHRHATRTSPRAERGRPGG